MWRTDLIVSTKQSVIVSLFYSVLILTMLGMFRQTPFDNVAFMAVILLIIEWWRAYCAVKTIRGELAIFYDINELYWARQRWYIVKKPLFLRYAVVIHLISKRNHKRRVLFLIDDSFSYQDWRSLNYFLRQFIAD